MNKQFQFMGTGQPRDPRWTRHSTPDDGKWCVTRKSPVMQLLVAGKTWGFTMSMPPPEELIGHKIGLHVGATKEPLKTFSDSAKAAISMLHGVGFDDWREAFRNWETADPGRFVGSATLVAAFRTGGLMQDCVRPWRQDSLGHTYFGRWAHFAGRIIRPVGNWTPGRWVWCFESAAPAPKAGPDPKCNGWGWIWNASKGLKIRQREQNGLLV